MTSIHEAAAKGYAVSAKTYVTGRPDYPDETQAWLRDTVGLRNGRTVLDLGSGTGKFLPLLRRTGATLLAVEPVDAMRAITTEKNNDVRVMSGTATAIPLEDATVDAVLCAQAFHWFGTKEALAEIRRVLKTGGVLGLIWNVRDERVPWVAALTAIMAPFVKETPRYASGAWRSVFPAEGFEFIAELHAPNNHTGDPEQVIVDRVMSVSFIAALPAREKAEVEQKVRSLIAATPELAASQVTFPYDTAMFAYRKVR